jgi:phosphate:Na+ symporter
MAQFLFNLAGVLILLPFIPQFTQFVMSLGGDAGQQAANANTISNIIAAGVFILILKPFGDLIIRMIPGKEEEILFQTVSLDGKLSPDNQEAFKMIEKELQHLLSNTGRVMDDASLLLSGKDGMAFRRLTKREALDDFLDERIEQAIVEITERPLNQKEAMQAVLLVRMSNALEQVSDLGMSIGYAARHMDAKGEQLSIEAIEEINSVQSRLREALTIIAKRFPSISQEDVIFMKQNDEKMREQINKSYSRHLVRLSVKSYSPGTYVKCLSRLEAAHSKLREIRKLTEQYSTM